MIEKERLEELIKQGATIYKFYGSSLDEYRLNRYDNYIEEDTDLMYCDNVHFLQVFVSSITDLFETKEDAEWHKEFGCIERTERLELPTWEEFKANRLKNDFYGVNFIAKASGCYYVLYISDDIKKMRLYDAACFEEVFSGEPTKENYTLACRKAKELFLGKDS